MRVGWLMQRYNVCVYKLLWRMFARRMSIVTATSSAHPHVPCIIIWRKPTILIITRTPAIANGLKSPPVQSNLVLTYRYKRLRCRRGTARLRHIIRDPYLRPVRQGVYGVQNMPIPPVRTFDPYVGVM